MYYWFILFPGLCLTRLNCSGLDTRDSYGRHRFFPIPLSNHLQMGPFGSNSAGSWLWFYTYYPTAKKAKESVENVGNETDWDCCSDTAIGFHKVQPLEMYVYDYLIYRIHPYGHMDDRVRQQRTPAPPPDANLKV